jgi:zinc protease
MWSSIFRARALLAAAALLAFAAPHAAAQTLPAAAVDGIRPDPAVSYGVLPNGLRYAIMQRDRPERGLSVRLEIGVGSFEESDAERGVAHFVEHMAFNGTRNFPEGELETRFAAAGIGFGRDQNAWTSLDATRYAADVAVADAAKLDLVFGWLADVAYGQSFTPEAVDRERGVVIAEHDRRLSPAYAIAEARERWRAPELRGPTRRPIGTREAIRSVTPATLAAFHRRWYRPDNAFVVVVGDFPPAELERRIREAFSPWTASGPAPARAAKSRPNLARGLDVLTQAEPSSASGVEVCLARPYEDEPDGLARRRRFVARGLWQAVLNERIGRRARAGNTPLLQGGASVSGAYDEATYACLIATPNDDDWRGALALVTEELRRLQAHGVTDEEIKTQLRVARSTIATFVTSAVNRPSPVLADAIAGDMADGDIFEHPSETLRIYDQLAAAVAKAEVDAAFARDWSGAGPLIAVVGPAPPTAQAVRKAWSHALAAPAPAAYAEQSQTFAYDGFGAPGFVVRREVVADPGFLRFTFSNGVILNLKPLPETGAEVGVTALFGEGRREIARADLNAARMGANLFASGGTKRQSQPDIRTALADRRVGASLSLNNQSFALNGTTTAADLKTQLQLLTAYIAEPGFRSEFETAYRGILETVYRQLDVSPEARAAEAFAETLAPGSPDDTPDKAVMLGLTSRDFARVLSPALAEAPIELTIVGDVSEAGALAAVSETFGALPPRRPGKRVRDDAWFFRFPERWPEVIRATHKGDRERAVVLMVWPLYVADPVRRREERALGLLGEVFDSRLRRLVREAKGQTYAPQVSVDMPDFADQGRLTVVVQTSPGEANRVVEEVRQVAAELAAGQGLELADLDAERRAVLDRAASRKRTVNWWRQTLVGSSDNDQNLRDQLDWEAVYRGLTPAEVKKAAADWLTRRPVTVVSVPAAPTTTAAASGRPPS